MPFRIARRGSRGPGSFRLWSTGAAFAYATAILVPLYVVFAASTKTNAEIIQSPLALPTTYSFSNFADAWEIANLGLALRNSVMAVVMSLVVTLALAFPAAYAVARIKVRLAAVVEGFFAVGILIPAIAILLPVFLLAANLGMLNQLSFLFLFYPATVLPLSVILLASFIRSIPPELDESATIDGASRFQIMMKLILPMARPGVLLVLILNFIHLWNEFLFALVLTNKKSRTIQIAVGTFSGDEFRVDFGLVAAAVVISIIPTLVLYFTAQKQIVGGGIGGALK